MAMAGSRRSLRISGCSLQLLTVCAPCKNLNPIWAVGQSRRDFRGDPIEYLDHAIMLLIGGALSHPAL